MQVKIFYHSGTGNCYSVARNLARLLAGEIEQVGAYMRAPHAVEEEIIGIVTPTYTTDLPAIVAQFLQQVELTQAKYIFCVTTMGAVAGRTLAHAKEILTERHLPYKAGFELTLPDNSIIFPSPAKLKAKFLAQEAEKVEAIATKVEEGVDNAATCQDSFLWKAVNAIGFWGLYHIFDIRSKHVDSALCTGCGTCAAVCPAQSISIVSGKVTFASECYDCFACAHWCPMGALKIGRLPFSAAKRYIHPEVSIAEMEQGAKKAELKTEKI